MAVIHVQTIIKILKTADYFCCLFKLLKRNTYQHIVTLFSRGLKIQMLNFKIINFAKFSDILF